MIGAWSAMGAMLAMGIARQPEAPLAPTGKWQVDYADNMCVLSRAYGANKDVMTLGVRPWPMGDSTELVLAQQGGYGVGIQTGKASVMLDHKDAPIAGRYNSYYTAKSKMRIVTINIPQAAMARLPEAESITIVMSGRSSVALQLINVKGALTALSTCTDDLLRTWHIDPAERLNIATPAAPVAGYQDWIDSDDYPADSISRASGGTTSMVWTVDTEGKVKNCSIAATSGDPALDAAACAAITRRGRYKPALDKSGKPIAVHNTRRVVWRLPD